MKEGFYAIEYGGAAGSGFGMMVLETGTLVGADSGGAHYDGTYQYDARSEVIAVDVLVSVPAGTWLVTGFPAQPHPWTFRMQCSFPRNADNFTIKLDTGIGEAAARIRFVRRMPE